MALRIESQAEPIPGYRLIERLGGGGFGEVWKAEAPGGIFKAIKFVYGHLQSTESEDNARAEQEFKALSRVKSVRHPFILSLERYDVIDSELIIVMELADRTLWDRYTECRKSGMEGIPRAELLAYIRDTAEALDFMNSEFQLQHLDIKPQNLFLVHNHVKVADFGLVKDLEGVAATVTGGVTPVYAAPETFDGWISRFSDQYSLAIVYQELLTGKRPFTGSTMRQLVMQHLTAKPDLSCMPAADRPAMTRALAKNPDERFPTCLQFIAAIEKAGACSVNVIGEPPQTPHLASADLTDTEQRANLLPAAAAAPREMRAPVVLDGDEKTLSHKQAVNGVVFEAKRPAKSAAANDAILIDGAGEIVPAVIIGLGHVGLRVLKQFRRDLVERFGGAGVLPHVRLLYVDTDCGALAAATDGGSSALLAHEVLHVRLRRPSHFLKKRDDHLDAWLDHKLLFQIPRQQTHAGMRALGRLAFVDNYRLISSRVEAELNECSAPDTLHRACRQTGLEMRSSKPRVYIVTGLAGGTGSGMFLDLAYVVRGLLKKIGAAPEMIGLFVLPSPTTSKPALANTFAALTELNHFNDGNAVFSARYDNGGGPNSAEMISELGAAFQRCVLIPGPTAKEDDDRCLARSANLLYNDLFSPLGCRADEIRAAAAPHNGGRRNRGYQAFRIHRLAWPRHIILRQAANKLCQRVVEHWMAKPRKQPREDIEQRVLENWDQIGFRPENLIERLKKKLSEMLKQDAEQMLSESIVPVKSMLTQSNKQRGEGLLNLAPVVQALASLDSLVSPPGDDSDAEPVADEETASIEKAIRQASDALAAECDQKLVELVVRMIEDPQYRLAGAEEAIRHLTKCIEQALESYEELSGEVRDRAMKLYRRIETLTESRPAPSLSSTTPAWRAAFSRKPAPNHGQIASELLEHFENYPKARFQSLILQQITRIYTSLRGHLSDEIREIGFCRTRLTELLELLKNARTPPKEINNSTKFADKCLLPVGCVDTSDAIDRFEKEITPEDVLSFDGRAQTMIRKQYRALVELCMASSSAVKALAPALHNEAETFLNGRLAEVDVADMFLSQRSQLDEEKVKEELAETFRSAEPEFGRASCHGQISLVVVPKTAAGERLAQLFQAAAPKVRIAFSTRLDEISVYRESCDLALSDLDALYTSAQEAYVQGSARDPSCLHSRTDITDWRMTPVAR